MARLLTPELSSVISATILFALTRIIYFSAPMQTMFMTPCARGDIRFRATLVISKGLQGLALNSMKMQSNACAKNMQRAA